MLGNYKRGLRKWASEGQRALQTPWAAKQNAQNQKGRLDLAGGAPMRECN
jgi:hypothetical protein